MSLGLGQYGYQQLSNDFINDRRYRYGYYQQRTNFNGTTNNNYRNSVSENGNTCTDGKDDGKIGFLSAAGSIIKGAAKGLWNGLKGCVTDSNGKFSLGKTLLTAAVGATCVIFPAVGLVACGIGAVAGGVKLVKGVVNASQATTDGAKKDAFEQIGDGGLTVALSVAGAKASYNGVVKTAGASSKITAMKDAGTWKDASMLQKAGALGKDMVASTKNQAGLVKNAALTGKEALEIQKLRRQVAKIDPNSATEKELSLIKELDVRETIASDALDLANKMPTKTTFANGAKGIYNGAKTKLSNLSLKNIAGNLKNIKNSANFASVKSALSAKSQAVINFLTTGEGTYAQAVQQFGYQNVAEALEVFAGYRMVDEII